MVDQAFRAGVLDASTSPGGRSQPRSLLRRRAALVLTTTALVTAGAYGYAALVQPTYTAHARVLVEPYTLPNAADPAPDMGTEQAIATSGAVLANAARAVGMSQDAVDRAADVSVSANANVLDFGFAASDRTTATDGATAVAAAYMAYRARTTTTSNSRTNVVQTLATPKVRTRLITSAARPGAPSAPDPVIDIIAGLIVGLVAGAAVAFAADRFGQRLRSLTRWQEATGVPVLAGLQRDTMIDDSHGARPDDRSSMVLRYLRMRVSQSLCAGGAVLLVTEVREQPERAAIARYLATALGETGWTAALIEMTRDVTQPAVMSDRSATDHETPARPFGDLRVRTSQTPDPGKPIGASSPWQAMTVDDLLRLVERLRRRHDVVVVTGPPVFTSVTTLDVAGVADAALLLDNVATARRNDALRSIAELRAAGCQICGGVLLGLGTARTGEAGVASMPADHTQTPSRALSASLRRAPLFTWTERGDVPRGIVPIRDHIDGNSK